MLTVILCFVMQVLTSSSPITHRSCWAGWRSENTGNTCLTDCHGNQEWECCVMYVILTGILCALRISQTFLSLIWLIWLWKVHTLLKLNKSFIEFMYLLNIGLVPVNGTCHLQAAELKSCMKTFFPPLCEILAMPRMTSRGDPRSDKFFFPPHFKK